jgi:hypothetical protein
MENETLGQIFNMLHKIDREQGVILEKLSGLNEDSMWLEGRVDKLEESTQGITWLKQTKNLLLWICALAGGISAVVTVISQR